jgi:hypothetical protein
LNKKKLVLVSGLGLVLLLTGCIKPYNEPKHVTIEPNETAFVLPLEGKTSDQKEFESVDFLEQSMVASKRIRIPRKEIQVGRGYWNVEYLDTMRVIKVNRLPETREWTEEQSIRSESKDSIKFSTGISATSSILPEDTPSFLYTYSGKSLDVIMDYEIRNRLETKMIEEFSKLSMDEIRSKKSDVIEKVSSDVTSYFKDAGITISNIGYKGDLQYEDPAVQDAITAKFNAEREQEAQEVRNQTEIDRAKAQKTANEIRKESMKEIIELRELDIQEQIAEGLSNGTLKLPDTLLIGEGGNMLFDIPVKDKENK